MQKSWVREMLRASAIGAVALPAFLKAALVLGEFISTKQLQKTDPKARSYFIDLQVEIIVPFVGRKSVAEPWCWLILSIQGGLAGALLGLLRLLYRRKVS